MTITAVLATGSRTNHKTPGNNREKGKHKNPENEAEKERWIPMKQRRRRHVWQKHEIIQFIRV